MKYCQRVLALLITFSLFGLGCDSALEEAYQQNQTTTDFAWYTPAEMDSAVAELFTDYWIGNYWHWGTMPLAAMSDEIICDWSNVGIRELSKEPRIPFDNRATGRSAEDLRRVWFQNYLVITKSYSIISSFKENELLFEQNGIHQKKYEAYALLLSGMAYGQLALRYDQGFIIEDSPELTENALVSYDVLLAKSISLLEESILKSGQLEAEDNYNDWVFGVTLDGNDIKRLAHSYIARFSALSARSVFARSLLDWRSILNHAALGIEEDFAPVSNDDGNVQWDAMKHFSQESTSWSIADYRTVGPADESGGYQNWLLEEDWSWGRYESFLTSDRRIQSETSATEGGTDFKYIPACSGACIPESQLYNRSQWSYDGAREYIENGLNGPMEIFKKTEIDLLKAEAMLHLGDLAGAAGLINITRVHRGELPPADENDGRGQISDEAGHLKFDGLWAMLKHEKHIELYATGVGIAFYDDRGWGDLITGTPIHFPVPASDLQLIQIENYTFGGSGDGSAPKNVRQYRRPTSHPMD